MKTHGEVLKGAVATFSNLAGHRSKVHWMRNRCCVPWHAGYIHRLLKEHIIILPAETEHRAALTAPLSTLQCHILPYARYQSWQDLVERLAPRRLARYCSVCVRVCGFEIWLYAFIARAALCLLGFFALCRLRLAAGDRPNEGRGRQAKSERFVASWRHEEVTWVEGSAGRRRGLAVHRMRMDYLSLPSLGDLLFKDLLKQRQTPAPHFEKFQIWNEFEYIVA